MSYNNFTGYNNFSSNNFSSSVVSQMPLLVSSAELTQASAISRSFSVSSIMPSISSAIIASVEGVKILDAAIISTMPTIQSSATFFNGIISIVVGERNNIDIVVKSRNINIK
jgi:hypothetical protein